MANSLEKKTRHFTCLHEPRLHRSRRRLALDEGRHRARRRAVFIDEQGVPEALEWEADDPPCAGLSRGRSGVDHRHCASARRWPHRPHGGVAGLAPARRRGRLAGGGAAGGAGGVWQVHLSAQTHAVAVLCAPRFVVPRAPEYLDAGIPHRSMRLNLKNLKQRMNIRIGHGFDVHAFAEGTR
jgi:hypothetical protein